MRSLLIAVLLAVPGCFWNITADDDPPPIARCPPAEPPQTLRDGPYGSEVQTSSDIAAYPSFKSDYPKQLVFTRATSSVRIEYFHEDKSIVETWSVGPLSTPPASSGACNVAGPERGELTIASVTIDGAPGDLSRYDGWTVTLTAGASLTYRSDNGRELTVAYRHGFAPIFTTPCPFHRPADGESCNETAICAYDKEGEHCTARCSPSGWQSFACSR